MKNTLLALALASAISPLTVAQKIDSPPAPKSVKKHRKGKKPKRAPRREFTARIYG
jgi:hypothetical protein